MKRFLLICFITACLLCSACQSAPVLTGDDLNPSATPTDTVEPEEQGQTTEPPTDEPEPDEQDEPAAPSLGYLDANDLYYGDVVINQTAEHVLVELLGEPETTTTGSDAMFDHPVKSYYYADAVYEAPQALASNNIIDGILVLGQSEKDSPRGIRVGDSVAEVLAKFPQEKDYTQQQPDGIYYFYGEDLYTGAAGYVEYNEDMGIKDSAILTITLTTADPFGPFLRIFCDNGSVASYRIYGYAN